MRASNRGGDSQVPHVLSMHGLRLLDDSVCKDKMASNRGGDSQVPHVLSMHGLRLLDDSMCKDKMFVPCHVVVTLCHITRM